MLKAVRKTGAHVHVLGTGGKRETQIRYSATLMEAGGAISPISRTQCQVVSLHGNQR